MYREIDGTDELVPAIHGVRERRPKFDCICLQLLLAIGYSENIKTKVQLYMFVSFASYRIFRKHKDLTFAG